MSANLDRLKGVYAGHLNMPPGWRFSKFPANARSAFIRSWVNW